MITHELNFEVTNRHGDVIYATVTWPTQSSDRQYPLVILLHGFKGFRNYGFFPMAAQHLASAGSDAERDAGMLVVRMDFSQNGMRGTAGRVTHPSEFAANTISRELDDTSDILTYLRTSLDGVAAQINEQWDKSLFLVGHSRGGGIAQVAGAELDAQKVVVWNSVGDWERWTPRQRGAWLTSGAVEVENTRTGQKLQMNSSYLEDIEAGRERMSLVTACSKLSDRLLFVHAEHDLTVTLKEVQNLLLRADSNASLRVISNTTHTFGMTHPLDHVTRAFIEVLKHTKTFLTAVFVVMAVTVFGGCALFVVGDSGRKSTAVERSQRSAQSVVYLFKEALDSSNVQAATDLMVHPSGRRLLAVERYEIADDVERWRRVMSAKPITETRADTLSTSSHRVHITLDYIKRFSFLTTRLEDNSWYVTSITAQQ